MIKIVFFDIDGTLVDDKDQVPASVSPALEALRAQGILTGISTGRCPSELRQFRAAHPELPFDVEVFANGALVRKDGQLIARHPLPKEEVCRLVEICRKNDLIYWVSDENEWYFSVADLSPLGNILLEDETLRADYHDPDHHLAHDVYMGEILLDEEKLREYPVSLREIELVRGMLLGGGPGPMLDFWSKNVSKATGVTECLETLGIRPEEAMAFGDSFNDIPILQLVGVGVAMGNGTAAVKKAADFVTKDLREDGIVYALHHFGLLNDAQL